MNSVAGDALEIQRRNLVGEPKTERQRHQRQNQEHLSRTSARRSTLLVRIQSQQVASGEVENMRHELRQFFG